MSRISALAVLLMAASLAFTACSGTKPQSANPLPSPSSAMPSAAADPPLSPLPPDSQSPSASAQASAQPPTAAPAEVAKPEAAKTPSAAAATAKPQEKPTVQPTASLQSPSPSAAASQLPAANNPAQAEALFKDNCMSCHGANLQGAFGPNLQHVGARKTKDQIVGQIQNGGGDMPGFGSRLSKEQVEILAAWLSAKK